MADGHVGTAGEMGAGERRDLGRERRLARAHDLGDRVGDRGDQVVLHARRHAHERPVLVGARVVGADDEPLEVVDVRVEPVGSGPADDLPRDRGRHRRVDQEATGPGRAGDRHLPDQGALVADDRRVELELAREPHRARDHPAGDERDHDASAARRPDRRHGVRDR